MSKLTLPYHPNRDEPDRRERGRRLVLVPAAFHIARLLQERHGLVQTDCLHAESGPANEPCASGREEDGGSRVWGGGQERKGENALESPKESDALVANNNDGNGMRRRHASFGGG